VNPPEEYEQCVDVDFGNGTESTIENEHDYDNKQYISTPKKPNEEINQIQQPQQYDIPKYTKKK